jgi:glycosyltransferase involved in cell wall biosynthesis
MTPRFSLLMASHNRRELLPDTIASALSQGFSDLELLIVDDASTDDSAALLATLDDPRVRVLHNETNLGFIRTLDRLVREARADAVGILDCDDALHPEAVGEVMRVFDADPGCGMVYTQHTVCDAQLRPLREGGCRPIPSAGSNLHHDLINHFKCFRRSAFARTCGFDPRTVNAEDKDLTYKLEEVAGVRFLPQALYFYRELADSASHQPSSAALGYASVGLARYEAYLRRLQGPVVDGRPVPNLTLGVVVRDLLGAANTHRRLGNARECAHFLARIVNALRATGRAAVGR